MKFRNLQENLRKTLWSRIEQEGLTGVQLAEQTGFRQAHISNFLNRKRGLSLEGMDKVLNVQRLSVLDLLDPNEVNKRASLVAPSEDGFESVMVVDPAVAACESTIMRMHVKDVEKFKRRFLARMRPAMVGERDNWERFVVIRVDAREGMSMYPRTLPGAHVLMDRHYNSLEPYRKGDASMYGVRKGGRTTIKYVEPAGKFLVLRPHNQAYPVEVLTIEEGLTANDYIVGRVCYVGIET